MSADPNSKPTSVEKAAIFLMTLGEEEAGKVLKNLGPKEVQKIGLAMSSLSNVQREAVDDVLDEFFSAVGSQTGLGMGNDDYIRNMLISALGEDKANTLVDRILLGGNTTGLDTLKWMDARSVAAVIRYEHPQIQSIVVAYLDADHAADVLSYLDDKVRLDIIMRVSKLESVLPEALSELNSIMEKQFSGGSGRQAANIGGVKCVAEIMNHVDTAVEATLMESIRDENEELGTSIQDLMFVFDNLKEVDDTGIQALLREVSSEVLILALKGADEEMQEKIFSNMSKRASELLRDDLEARGPVRLSDVEGAQKEILVIARRMADAGEIMLGGGGSEEMI
ncbi:MAG: flagellar motor switch protein FliG [Pseudomonadales bacterium]|nr:flagellar motor switch protein FliG [Pseudomonadales bacterium]